MEKMFRKYGIILPAAAIFWGIYISNVLFFDMTELDISNFIDQMLFGWRILWILFLIAASIIMHYLQNQKKWEYIYSFPVTKKRIYRECFLGLHISMIVAAVIYGIFFYIQCIRITKLQQSSFVIELIVSVIVNIIILFVWCAFTQLCLVILKHVWQGAVVSIGLVLFGIPCIVSDIGYFIQNVGSFKEAEVFEHVFYGVDEGIRLTPYMSNLCFNFYKEESAFKNLWTGNFSEIVLVISILLLILAVVVFGVSQKQFLGLDLSANIMVSRLKGRWNQIIPSLLSGIFVFHWVTNYQMFGWSFSKDNKLLFFMMMFQRKQVGNLPVMSGPSVCLTLILSMTVMWCIVWILRTIRRKINERTS